jgi:iron complex outermembrane receptor protein
MHQPVDFRARASATWQWREWEATGFINYTDDYRDVASQPARHVSSWVTADLNLVYRFPRHSHAQTSVALSSQNVFNTRPPFLNNPVGIGYDQENGDLTGRAAVISIRRSW